MNGKKKSSGKILVILLACLVIVLITGAACIFYFMNQEKESRQYSQKLVSARKYLMDENYDAVILECTDLIKLNAQEADVYLILGEAYELNGDIDAALDTYWEGYLATKNPDLKKRHDDLLNELESESESETEQSTEPVYPELNLEALSKSTDGRHLLQNLATFIHAQYLNNYGNAVQEEETQENILEVRYTNLNADVYYQNTDSTTIYSRTSLEPYSTAKPFKVSLDNPRNLLGVTTMQGITYEQICTILGKNPEIEETERSEAYELTFSWLGCSIRIACNQHGDIVEGAYWNEIILPMGETEEGENYYGAVVNAVTGEPVEGAYVTFIGDDGEYYEAEADELGEFSLQCVSGSYHLVIEEDGFIREERDIEVEEAEYELGSYSISPILENTDMRIVLEWGQFPQDLDAWLVGKYSDGTVAEVSFNNRELKAADGETLVLLDIDDRDGSGPETISAVDTNGTFTYRVEDYEKTGTMGTYKDAIVRVYLSDGSTKTYHVPEGTGNIWTVFEIDHGYIKDINTLK